MKILSLVLFAALTPVSYSQSVLYTFYGESAGDDLGRSVSGAGDVNNDGYADIVVGAPDANGVGRVLVYSGLDGSTLYALDDGSPLSQSFGSTVSGAGDVNNDGHDDVIVGEDDPFLIGEGLEVKVFSGVDGSVLHTFTPQPFKRDFGSSVSGAGDVNGDGHADVIVGALDYDPGSWGWWPAVWVFSGADGSVLYYWDANVFYPDTEAFGFSVSGAGDVNNDGYADLIVGSPFGQQVGGWYYPGLARVFSGLDGSLLYVFEGRGKKALFGRSVSGAGDVNGDGFDDVIVGAPGDPLIGHNGMAYPSKVGSGGSARVFSGMDGTVLHVFVGDMTIDNFGSSVSGAGDVNGDGFDDLIVGTDQGSPSYGYARVFSGFDGTTLYSISGDSPDDDVFEFNDACTTVSGAGDVNGDGYADLIVGAPYDDSFGSNAGKARVFSGK